MWDYICPACRKEVEKNSSRCPHCGEQYGNPVHVPPKVLKDPKVLEDYIHGYVFPRVSQAQRNYLAQYFTELFTDGFESGDFTAWTGTGGTPTIVSNPVHQGSYAAELGVNDYVYKDLASAYSELYCRIYLKMTNLPTNYGGTRIRFNDNVNNYRMSIGYEYTGSVYRFRLRNEVKATNIGTAYEVTLDTGLWYCLEIRYKADTDGTDGIGEAWLGENKIITGTAEDFDTYTVQRVRIDNTSGGSIYVVDSVVIADTYIGAVEEVIAPIINNNAAVLQAIGAI